MYQKYSLDNGLRLITSKIPSTHSVSLVLFIGVGSCYEIESKAGISHFVEHLCFKGTSKRQSAKEISEAIEATGGIINAGTDKELTVYWCKVASKHLFLALDVIADMTMNSRFDAIDVDLERKVIIDEINLSLDSPQQRVGMMIDEIIWKGQPLGRDVAGRRESVSALTRQQILDFYAKHYLPNNAVISIAGDIEHEQVKKAVENVFNDWKPGDIKPRFLSNYEQKAPELFVEIRNTEQMHLCLGVPGLCLFDDDRFAIDLLNVILGEGMSSRLFVELREKQGLAYEIYSTVDHFMDSGSMIIHAGIDPGRMEDALLVILDQLSLLRNDISETDLSRAKEMVKGRLLLTLENNRNLANWVGVQEILTEKILDLDDLIAQIDIVTLDDLFRVAQQTLRDDRLNLAIIGPVEGKKSLDDILKF